MGVWALSDEALVAAMASGDAAAASAFVRRFQARVYGLALSLVGDPRLAEEVAQDAFVRAWRHAAAYDPRRGGIVPWLLAITRNLALDARRPRRADAAEPQRLLRALTGDVPDTRHPDAPPDTRRPDPPPDARRPDTPPDARLPDTRRLDTPPDTRLADTRHPDAPPDARRLEELGDADRLRRCLRALPPEQSGALVLSVYFGLTSADIAEREGVSPGTARTRIRRGLARLRRALRPFA
jgi:RNA polymerase sigma-70 factor (ECF subfamily)